MVLSRWLRLMKPFFFLLSQGGSDGSLLRLHMLPQPDAVEPKATQQLSYTLPDLKSLRPV